VCKVAQWAVSNKIVDSVFGDKSIHREVVNRSAKLLEFLRYAATTCVSIVYSSAMHAYSSAYHVALLVD
jgi:hypothetical protein